MLYHCPDAVTGVVDGAKVHDRELSIIDKNFGPGQDRLSVDDPLD
jgi:hypothetical protein